MEIITDKSSVENVIKKYPDKKSEYLKMLEKVIENFPMTDICSFNANSSETCYIDGFGKDQDLRIKVLAPIPVMVNGKPWLTSFTGVGPTKNGNSIVLRLEYKDISVLLGGDLNTESEENILEHYGGAFDPKQPRKQIEAAKKVLKVDVAKSCHHGSSDFSEDFLSTINPLVTVISSGDEESYCHPRPDTLGAIGRYSEGNIRPLIFSTELARSSPERLGSEEELHKVLIKKRQNGQLAEFTEDLIQKMGRVISIYGMICLSTDGHHVLMAQKLETPGTIGRKWGLHLLKSSGGKLTYLIVDD